MATNTQRIAALETAVKALQALMAEERREFSWRTPTIKAEGLPADGARSFSVSWRRVDPTKPAVPVAVQLDDLPRVTVDEGAVFSQPSAATGRHVLRFFVAGADNYEIRHTWTVEQ